MRSILGQCPLLIVYFYSFYSFFTINTVKTGLGYIGIYVTTIYPNPVLEMYMACYRFCL
ncbi:hypothetical protein MNV_1070020 [Candidatus Methanoperedens nitroreducens]|uniref:Uncharacterized protein n=1 Tax=Candidatus Methanoperedens nitratireducens TaxID=1392998 RepID=A0A284VIQ4_9EURY|nr:hypothetical protein MNV_1070020 [Candidatus Methanoperedens nitroreducens]